MSAADAADAARQQFDATWGPRIEKAVLSRATLDDAELAGKMVASLSRRTRDAAFERLLCAKAYELGTKHPTGYLAAIRALRRLGRLEPGKRPDYEDAIFSLHEELYARTRGDERIDAGRRLVNACVRRADDLVERTDYDGAAGLYRRAVSVMSFVRTETRFTKEEVQAKLRQAVARAEAAQEAERLRNQLLLDPEDAQARRRLVHLYVVELDQPEKAEPYIPPDDKTRHFVVAATISHDALNEGACRGLGDWYRDLAGEASPEARVRMLLKATGYYRAFLEKHPAQDEARTEVQDALDQAAEGLARLSTSGRAPLPDPKPTVVSAKEFAKRYAAKFPPQNNVARGGTATASSFYGNRRPENVFDGARTGDAWTLNGPKGTFQAVWNPPVQGRYLLLFNRSSSPKADPWGNAAISLNGGRPFAVPTPTFGGHDVLIVDFGAVIRFASLRIAIDGQAYPGLAGLEVHR